MYWTRIGRKGQRFAVAIGLVTLSMSVWVAAAQKSEAPDDEPATSEPGPGGSPLVPRRGTEDNPLTSEEVRLYRAEQYAQEHGIPLGDALRQFEAQAASGEVVAQLEATSPDRLAGVWVEKAPERRLVAWYTGEEKPKDALDIAAESPIPVEIRTGAPLPLEQLVAISDSIGESFGPEARLGGRWVEVQTNTVRVRLQPDSPLQNDADRLSGELSAEFGANVLVTVGTEQAGDDD